MSTYVRAKTLKDEEKVVVGYYGHKRRYQGDVFELESDAHFSDKWMELCDAPIVEEDKKLDLRTKAGREHKAMQRSQLLP